jgi:hypothetical protein
VARTVMKAHPAIGDLLLDCRSRTAPVNPRKPNEAAPQTDK